MSISTTYETATLYGALDSAAAADGDSLSAHVLRAIAMSHNRAVTKACPMGNQVWPIHSLIPTRETSPVAPPGLCVIPVVDAWAHALYPVTIPKYPGHNFADAKIYIRADLATTIYATIGTIASPLDASRTTSHALVASCAGDATWRTISISDIPVDVGDLEHVSLYLRSPATATLGTTASFGSPNSWSCSTSIQDPEPRIVYGTTTATWNVTAGVGDAWDEHAHVLRVWDTASDDVVQPRAITYVTRETGATGPELHVSPYYSRGELDIIRLRGDTYRIEKVQRASLGGLSMISRFA